MKNTGLLFVGVLLLICDSVHAEPPLLPLEKAIGLAQEQLRIRNLEKTVYIQSVSLDPTSILGGNKVWKIMWSENFDASVGRIETGVEVNMRGEVVRLVKRAAELPKR